MPNINEQIQKTQQQIDELTNKKKKLLSKQKNEERRKRTKRLIERGAILESVIGNAEDFSNEQIKDILIKILSGENARAEIEKTRAEATAKGNPLF